MTTTDLHRAAPPTAAPTMLLGWDAIELWVGNARAFAGFLSSAFGFHVTSYAGPETGWPDQASYVLEQGRIRFVVTAALTPDSPIADHVREHGDGVHDLAFAVPDAGAAFEAAVARGARPLEEPHVVNDDHGALRLARIAAYGDTGHTFVDRSGYGGAYRPGYTADGLPPSARAARPVGLDVVDHVVANVEEGALERWVDFYRSVLGFERLRHFDDSQISTEYSALMSTVVWDGAKIVLPINEPAAGRRKSQIQEYIETYRGPGVQHIALGTADIVGAVSSLRERGLRFLEAPATYYDDAQARLGHLDLPWEDLRRLGILVDEEPDGWLLQIFTETLGDRPTLFVEIIQRGGARGFGAGNFKALFEAIEREQGAAAGICDPSRPAVTGFGVENLPYGVAVLPDGSTGCVTALDGCVIDLSLLARSGLPVVPGLAEGAFEDVSLNRFLACGRAVWEGVRRGVAGMARDGHPAVRAAAVPVGEVELLRPVAVGDFVDFSASIHHATRMGRLLRPEGEPLPPQWRQMPVGYHGRAGSLVPSGTAVTRPHGQVPRGQGGSALAPTAALDFEAEVGFVVGTGSGPGEPVPATAFADHVAGVVLVNDWSARDVQAYESRPLGPFLGKSFATSVSPWLVTLDALAPYRVAGPAQDPAPPPYLRTVGPAAYDLHIEVTLQSEAMRAEGLAPARLSSAAFAAMYWTAPQLLAHATVNGSGVRPGDLFASGTVSGSSPGSEACLLELTEGGGRPLSLPDGSTRAYLEDGDTVVVRAWAGGDGRPVVSLGEVTGTILPARTMEV